MSIKYVYDSNGKKTGVIIPIDIWNKNKSKILNENKEIKPKKHFKPSKYREY